MKKRLVFSILLVTVILFGCTSNQITNNQPTATVKPTPETTKEKTQIPAVTATAEPKSEVTLLSESVQILNNTGSENDLNYLSKSFKSTFEELGADVKKFPCNQIDKTNLKPLEILSLYIDNFPYDKEGMCIKLVIEDDDYGYKSYFDPNNGVTGNFFAIVGFLDYEIENCVESRYCGHWQPALVKFDLPKELWDGKDNAKEAEKLDHLVTSNIKIGNSRYYPVILNVYALSENQAKLLEKFVNEESTITLMQ